MPAPVRCPGRNRARAPGAGWTLRRDPARGQALRPAREARYRLTSEAREARGPRRGLDSGRTRQACADEASVIRPGAGEGRAIRPAPAEGRVIRPGPDEGTVIPPGHGEGCDCRRVAGEGPAIRREPGEGTVIRPGPGASPVPGPVRPAGRAR